MSTITLHVERDETSGWYVASAEGLAEPVKSTRRLRWLDKDAGS
jgi:hypothetical protein